MKDSKKNFLLLTSAVILTGLVVCLLLAGQRWQVDKDGHYRFCLFDTKVAYEAHTLVDEKCTVCCAAVMRLSDGAYRVTQENRHGDMVLIIRYNADDTVKSTQRREFLYDPSGKKLYEKDYFNDRLVAQIQYDTFPDGQRAPRKAINYLKDGTFEYYEYDDYHVQSKKITYNAWGWPGDVYVYENEYFENGARLQKTYVNGRLTVLQDTGGHSCLGGYLWHKKTVFHEDGSKTVYEYDQSLKLIKTTNYDAEGNIIK